MNNKIAVILLNLGGPNSVTHVKPFLYNLFLDEDIIKVPFRGVFRKGFAYAVSSLRSKSVAQKYAEISYCQDACLGHKNCSGRKSDSRLCCSPINALTENQRVALESFLNQEAAGSPQFVVKIAMRYWHPFTEEVQKELVQEQVSRIILLPLYPQFSFTTTGSSLHEWQKCALGSSIREIPTTWITNYHLNPDYLAAINDRISEGLLCFPESIRQYVTIVFSAHGTPISEKAAGDPYSKQIQETAQAIIQLRHDSYAYWLGWQSKVGPAKWLKPNTLDLLHNLIKKWGSRYILVVPIAFVTDHIETLHEIGIEFKEQAIHWGCQQFEFTKGLNDHPKLIQALADEVKKLL